ncbi:MAG: TonB-dependent receptor [Colwellia sp.]
MSFRFYGWCFFYILFQCFPLSADTKVSALKTEKIYYFNIARSNAANALNLLALQTDQILIYSYDSVKQYQANALYGYLTLPAALKYLLLDSGLKASTTLSGGISILPLEKKLTGSIQAIKANNSSAALLNDNVEVIEISGIRKNMLKAQDIKMGTGAIIDLIVAADIGTLSDLTAAENIVHLAGIQVTRFNDEVDNILIRGLSNYTTTYNGRELFTAEKRLVSLQDFSSQALAGIEVYKSVTADNIESGLAGLVNVRTNHPFDFEDEKISGRVHYSYNDQSEKSSPNGHFLYSNRWDSEIGELGVLANITYVQSEYYNGIRYNATWFPEAQAQWDILPSEFSEGGFVLPHSVGLYNDSGSRKRPSANLIIQWAPTEKLEIYFDSIFQGYRSEKFTDNFINNMTSSSDNFGEPSLENIVMVAGGNNTQVASVSKSNGRSPWMFRDTGEAITNTYQYAIGGIWQHEHLKIITDLAFTDSTYKGSNWSFDFAIDEPKRVDVDFFGDGGVVFDLPEFDVLDLDQYLLRGYYESRFMLLGEGVQWKTDLTYSTDVNFLHTIQVGIRYTDRDALRENGARYAYLLDLNKPIAEIDYLTMQHTKNPFRSDVQGFTQYLAPTRTSIVNNHHKLAKLAYDSLLTLADDGASWAADDAENWMESEVSIDPSTYFLMNEKSYALYLQAKSYFEIDAISIDTVVGVRAVQTASVHSGISTTTRNSNSILTRRTTDNDNLTILPNINLRAELTDTVQFHLGYRKTLTRPDFADLNPAVNIEQVFNQSADNSTEPDIDAIGSSGNPNLKPLISNNYDISLDYYFSDTGYVSVASFYRDIGGFTNVYTRLVEDDIYGTVQLTRPENDGDGRIYGYELSGQTFFDFLPIGLKGIGFSANLTYLRGQSRQHDDGSNLTHFAEIPGLSKWTYNLAVLYELEGFGARLSYNYRSSWTNWYGQQAENIGFTGSKTRARNRLDLSLSYKITQNYQFFADVRNILAEPFRNYVQLNEHQYYDTDVRDEGRYFGIGLRFSF